MLTLKERIDLMARLGDHLRGEDEFLDALIHQTSFNNLWFIQENQHRSINAIACEFLDRAKLKEWSAAFDIPEEVRPQKVGIIMAGNIPLVGFHDLLCVFIAGHQAKIKLSDKDRFLLPYLIKLLGKMDERSVEYFEIVERLNGFDAVIATGSDNASRYFEAYFSKYPHIIRKNRNAVALLIGTETKEDLRKLGEDIFLYFGLGCRNVSKVFVPQDYDFTPLLETLHEFRKIVNHTRYKNNFDYNYALYLINKEKFLNNGCIMLVENQAIPSRIATLHYQYYRTLEEVSQFIEANETAIQCVVSQKKLPKRKTIPFGQAQSPSLFDYADGVDTVKWLIDNL